MGAAWPLSSIRTETGAFYLLLHSDVWARGNPQSHPRAPLQSHPSTVSLRCLAMCTPGGCEAARLVARSSRTSQDQSCHTGARMSTESYRHVEVSGIIGTCENLHLTAILQLPLPYYQHLTQPRQIEAQQRTIVGRAQSSDTMHIFSNFHRGALFPLQPYLWRGSRSLSFGVQCIHSSLHIPARGPSCGTCGTEHLGTARTMRRNTRKTPSHQSRYVRSTKWGSQTKARTVLKTASKLLSRELEMLGIQLPQTCPRTPLDSGNRPLLDYHALQTVPDLSAFNQHEETVLLDHLYLNGQADGSMSYNLLDMPPEMYETFSQIEPISFIMDPGFGLY
jgi:hypothetical protein